MWSVYFRIDTADPEIEVSKSQISFYDLAKLCSVSKLLYTISNSAEYPNHLGKVVGRKICVNLTSLIIFVVIKKLFSFKSFWHCFLLVSLTIYNSRYTLQILALKDRHNRTVTGDAKKPKRVIDYVVFERHLTDPYGRWRICGKLNQSNAASQKALATASSTQNITWRDHLLQDITWIYIPRPRKENTYICFILNLYHTF